MSTPRHAKPTAQPTAQPTTTIAAQTQAPAQQAPAAAPDSVAAALVQPQAPNKDSQRDPGGEDIRYGQGGLYTVQDGRRVLLEQTRSAT